MPNKSESLVELAKALNLAQKALGGAKKDANNPFFKSTYTTLSSVWDACKGPLTDNGLSVTQTMGYKDGMCFLETTLLHLSGEWIAGRLRLNPVKDDPQGLGSAITYARRYSLAAMVGVCPEDDDGEAAMARKPKAVDEQDMADALMDEAQASLAPSQSRSQGTVQEPTGAKLTLAQARDNLRARIAELNWTNEEAKAWLADNFDGATSATMTARQVSEAMGKLVIMQPKEPLFEDG